MKISELMILIILNFYYAYMTFKLIIFKQIYELLKVTKTNHYFLVIQHGYHKKYDWKNSETLLKVSQIMRSLPRSPVQNKKCYMTKLNKLLWMLTLSFKKSISPSIANFSRFHSNEALLLYTSRGPLGRSGKKHRSSMLK